MNWDSIEVKWSEMARRATGAAGPTKPSGSRFGQIKADDPVVELPTAAAALAARKPERSTA